MSIWLILIFGRKKELRELPFYHQNVISVLVATKIGSKSIIQLAFTQGGPLIKGSLDEKLQSYEVLKMRENRRVENSKVENSKVE